MKYAIVEHSGKQYLAEEGGRIEVDRLPLEVGKPVEFKEVLLVTDGKVTEVGSPYVSGAKVQGKVLEHGKAKKITVFKYKPKQRYRRTQGHRQKRTRITIETVDLPGSKAEQKAKAADKSAKASPTKRSSKSSAKKTSDKKAASKTKSSGKQSESKSKSKSGSKKSGRSSKTSEK